MTRIRIAGALLLSLGLTLSAGTASARGGRGSLSGKSKSSKIKSLGTAKRTGNSTGNAETAEKERKIEDGSEKYGNEVNDTPAVVEEQKPTVTKPATKKKKAPVVVDG